MLSYKHLSIIRLAALFLLLLVRFSSCAYAKEEFAQQLNNRIVPNSNTELRSDIVRVGSAIVGQNTGEVGLVEINQIVANTANISGDLIKRAVQTSGIKSNIAHISTISHNVTDYNAASNIPPKNSESTSQSFPVRRQVEKIEQKSTEPHNQHQNTVAIAAQPSPSRQSGSRVNFYLSKDNSNLLETTVARIKEEYPIQLHDAELVENALRGIVNNLDPYSRYLTPQERESKKNESVGIGIGIECFRAKNGMMSCIPYQNGPAYLAGVRAGDIIIGVDGVRILPTDSDQKIIDKLRGELGSYVLLEIRSKDGAIKTLRIRREILAAQYARWKFFANEKIGYIKINEINAASSANVKRIFIALQNKAARFRTSVEGLILDLRDNLGGSLESAVSIADMFLKKTQKIVVYKTKRGTVRNVHYSNGYDISGGIPIVVLINRYTASAAEIIAAALKDNKRALLVGMKTYGKACIQKTIPLANGAAISLVVGVYYTPNGNMIESIGIAPDVVVPEAAIVKVPELQPGASQQVIDSREKIAAIVNKLSDDRAGMGVANTSGKNPVDISHQGMAARDGAIDPNHTISAIGSTRTVLEVKNAGNNSNQTSLSSQNSSTVASHLLSTSNTNISSINTHSNTQKLGTSPKVAHGGFANIGRVATDAATKTTKIQDFRKSTNDASKLNDAVDTNTSLSDQIDVDNSEEINVVINNNDKIPHIDHAEYRILTSDYANDFQLSRAIDILLTMIFYHKNQ